MYRERRHVNEYVQTDQWWHYIANTWYESVDNQKLITYDTRTTASLKDWRERLKSGMPATTPLSGKKHVEALVGGSTFLHMYGWVTPEWPHQYDPPVWTLKQVDRSLNTVAITHPGYDDGSTDLSMDDITADNLALRETYRAIRKERTTFQGLIFLGEAREALRMIRSPAQSLRQGLGYYLSAVEKRTKGVKPKALNKIIGETWLEYSFGWRPFVQDLDDAHKAYFALDRHNRSSRITRVGKNVKARPISVVGCTAGRNVSGIKETRTATTVTVRYIVGLRTDVQLATPFSGFERFGLVASQFVPTIWELMPWSFLFDYFTNIGDILDAGATATNDVLWVNKTVRRECVRTCTVRVDNKDMQTWYPAPSYVWGGTPGKGEVRITTVERSGDGLSMPRFEVSVPTSPNQWINMAALAVVGKRLTNSLQENWKGRKT